MSTTLSSGGHFERVYRDSRLVRVLEFIYLPMELAIGLGGALVFVSAPLVVLLGVEKLGWLEVSMTMVVAGAFAWWGGSTSYRLGVDLLRGTRAFEGKVHDVASTTRRSGKGGTYPVVVFHVAGHAFQVDRPPTALSSALHLGGQVRVLETQGSRTVREVWVLRD